MSLPPFQHLVDEHWRDVARLAHALAPGHGDDVAQQAWTQDSAPQAAAVTALTCVTDRHDDGGAMVKRRFGSHVSNFRPEQRG